MSNNRKLQDYFKSAKIEKDLIWDRSTLWDWKLTYFSQHIWWFEIVKCIWSDRSGWDGLDSVGLPNSLLVLGQKENISYVVYNIRNGYSISILIYIKSQSHICNIHKINLTCQSRIRTCIPYLPYIVLCICSYNITLISNIV